MKNYETVRSLVRDTGLILFKDGDRKIMLHIPSEKTYEVDVEKMKETPLDDLSDKGNTLRNILLDDKFYLDTPEDVNEFIMWSLKRSAEEEEEAGQ